MTTPAETLLAILQQYFNPREEGWLWVAFYDDDQPGVVEQIEGDYEDVAATVTGLSQVINGVSFEHAHLAVCRREGRPTEADRELWRGLREAVDAARLVDLVVFNDRDAWSMRDEDRQAQRAALG